MGREIVSLIQRGFTFKDYQFHLVDTLNKNRGLQSATEKGREPAQVWIDFSRPEGTLDLLKTIDTPVVIGTTGFSDEQWKKVLSYSEKRPVLFAPNMAPGMNALFDMLEKSSFSPHVGFEVVTQEAHHKHKQDSPSGTMKRILKSLEGLGYSDVPVQVSRIGEVFGVHSVKFVSADEEITIEHRVLNRSVFAKGALLAAQFLLQNREPKIYSFSEVLES